MARWLCLVAADREPPATRAADQFSAASGLWFFSWLRDGPGVSSRQCKFTGQSGVLAYIHRHRNFGWTWVATAAPIPRLLLDSN